MWIQGLNNRSSAFAEQMRGHALPGCANSACTIQTPGQIRMVSIISINKQKRYNHLEASKPGCNHQKSRSISTNSKRLWPHSENSLETFKRPWFSSDLDHVYGSIINKKRDIPRYWTHIEPGWWYTCPSEEYEFVSRDDYIFPYIMEGHKTHVPNHQPVYYYIAIVYTLW